MPESLVTVLLPTYNSESTIERCIRSVLDQSFHDICLLVLDDGSIDGTQDVVTNIVDNRLVYIKRDHNGLGRTLNYGINRTQSKYIARIDADDIAVQDRFEKQVEFLEENEDISVLGTAILVRYPDGKSTVRKRPTSPEDVLRNTIRICPVVHPTVMMRTIDLKKAGGYNTKYDGSLGRSIGMDYYLWVEMLSAGFKIANLKETLTIHYKSIGSVQGKKTLSFKLKERWKLRMWAVKKLGIGGFPYIDIFFVEVLTVLSHYGLRIDNIFNLIGR